MDACVELARDFGDWLARPFQHAGVPVCACRNPSPTGVSWRTSVDPGFEGLAAALAAEDGAPDYGPRRAHPTAGATVVGARPFLIAWNIQLDTHDLGLARRIASRIRERDGGLPAVQALGIPLVSLGCVQVSMNLLDHRANADVARVRGGPRSWPPQPGIGIRDSELIGLAPLAAFLDTADHIGVDDARSPTERVLAAARWLGIRDATSDMALELRLDARLARCGSRAIRRRLNSAESGPGALLQDHHRGLLRDRRDGDRELGDGWPVGDAHLLEEPLQGCGPLIVVTERHGDDEIGVQTSDQLRGAGGR